MRADAATSLYFAAKYRPEAVGRALCRLDAISHEMHEHTKLQSLYRRACFYRRQDANIALRGR